MCDVLRHFLGRLGVCLPDQSLGECLSECPSPFDDRKCYDHCYRLAGWTPPASVAEKIVYPTTAAVLLLLSLLISCMMSSTLGLDMSALQAAMDGDDPVVRAQARRVASLRTRGSLLLCTLLVASTGVNVAFTVLLSNILGILIGFVACTVLLLVFVEILPPALCAHHALRIAAGTAWVARSLVVVLFPIAWPVSLVLDKYLSANGEESQMDNYFCSSICKYLGCIKEPQTHSPRVFITNPLADKDYMGSPGSDSQYSYFGEDSPGDDHLASEVPPSITPDYTGPSQRSLPAEKGESSAVRDLTAPLIAAAGQGASLRTIKIPEDRSGQVDAKDKDKYPAGLITPRTEDCFSLPTSSVAPPGGSPGRDRPTMGSGFVRPTVDIAHLNGDSNDGSNGGPSTVKLMQTVSGNGVGSSSSPTPGKKAVYMWSTSNGARDREGKEIVQVALDAEGLTSGIDAPIPNLNPMSSDSLQSAPAGGTLPPLKRTGSVTGRSSSVTGSFKSALQRMTSWSGNSSSQPPHSTSEVALRSPYSVSEADFYSAADRSEPGRSSGDSGEKAANAGKEGRGSLFRDMLFFWSSREKQAGPSTSSDVHPRAASAYSAAASGQEGQQPLGILPAAIAGVATGVAATVGTREAKVTEREQPRGDSAGTEEEEVEKKVMVAVLPRQQSQQEPLASTSDNLAGRGSEVPQPAFDASGAAMNNIDNLGAFVDDAKGRQGPSDGATVPASGLFTATPVQMAVVGAARDGVQAGDAWGQLRGAGTAEDMESTDADGGKVQHWPMRVEAGGSLGPAGGQLMIVNPLAAADDDKADLSLSEVSDEAGAGHIELQGVVPRVVEDDREGPRAGFDEASDRGKLVAVPGPVAGQVAPQEDQGYRLLGPAVGQQDGASTLPQGIVLSHEQQHQRSTTSTMDVPAVADNLMPRLEPITEISPQATEGEPALELVSITMPLVLGDEPADQPAAPADAAGPEAAAGSLSRPAPEVALEAAEGGATAAHAAAGISKQHESSDTAGPLESSSKRMLELPASGRRSSFSFPESSGFDIALESPTMPQAWDDLTQAEDATAGAVSERQSLDQGVAQQKTLAPGRGSLAPLISVRRGLTTASEGQQTSPRLSESSAWQKTRLQDDTTSPARTVPILRSSSEGVMMDTYLQPILAQVSSVTSSSPPPQQALNWQRAMREGPSVSQAGYDSGGKGSQPRRVRYMPPRGEAALPSSSSTPAAPSSSGSMFTQTTSPPRSWQAEARQSSPTRSLPSPGRLYGTAVLKASSVRASWRPKPVGFPSEMPSSEGGSENLGGAAAGAGASSFSSSQRRSSPKKRSREDLKSPSSDQGIGRSFSAGNVSGVAGDGAGTSGTAGLDRPPSTSPLPLKDGVQGARKAQPQSASLQVELSSSSSAAAAAKADGERSWNEESREQLAGTPGTTGLQSRLITPVGEAAMTSPAAGPQLAAPLADEQVMMVNSWLQGQS
eukprot:SM000050S17025  [mRNA]  locus=s50:558920:565742:+ [translate_table: standard]